MSGDLILEVNGQDLRTAAYEHVAYTLKVDRFDLQCLSLILFRLDTSTWTCKYQNRTSESQCSYTNSSKFPVQ